jgi:hypothetical protein
MDAVVRSLRTSLSYVDRIADRLSKTKSKNLSHNQPGKFRYHSVR